MQKDPPLVAITTVVSGVAERERKRGREFSGPWTASNLALSLSLLIPLFREQKRKSIFDDDALTVADCRCCVPSSSSLRPPVPLRPGFRGERGHSTERPRRLFHPFLLPSSPFLGHVKPDAENSKRTRRARGKRADLREGVSEMARASTFGRKRENCSGVEGEVWLEKGKKGRVLLRSWQGDRKFDSIGFRF